MILVLLVEPHAAGTQGQPRVGDGGASFGGRSTRTQVSDRT